MHSDTEFILIYDIFCSKLQNANVKKMWKANVAILVSMEHLTYRRTIQMDARTVFVLERPHFARVIITLFEAR